MRGGKSSRASLERSVRDAILVMRPSRTVRAGILGLILPGALGILPVLTPLAACGMVMFMTGAATTRFRRSEWKHLGPDLLCLSLSAFVAWGRFDLQPF